MKYFNDRDIVSGTRICPDLDESMLKHMIDRINDGRFNLLILSDSCKEFNKIEPWFQTEYAEIDFPSKYTKLWTERWLHPELLLPSPNRFICKVLDIHSEPAESSVDIPVLILQTENCRCFHKLDKKFQLPHGIINIKFISSLTKQSVTNINLTTIFSMCVKSLLLESLYPAKVAGYNYKITSIDSGLILLLSGYNEKLPNLLDAIVKCMLSVSETMTKMKFDAFRKNLKKLYFNMLINSNLLNEDCRQQIIKPSHKFYFDRYRNIDRITVEDFNKFTKDFLKCLQPRLLIQGNISKCEALQIANKISETFKCIDRKSCANNRPPNANEVAVGTTSYKIKSMLPNDTNSVIKNYYQIGNSTLVLENLLEILQKIIREPLFNSLRTQEQLGYSVSCSVKRDYKMLGFVITIESQEKKYSATMVDEKIDNFLKDFLATLQTMNDADFDTMKNSIIALKQSEDTDLTTEVDRNWKEIMKGRNKFDRSKLDVVKMQAISKNHVINFYEQHFICPESVRKLSVQVLSNAFADCGNSDSECGRLHLCIL